MAELATADIDYIIVSSIDADRPGPHYTSDMVRLLQAEAGSNTEIYFLMGMDSLRDLPTWHEAAWLVEHARLVALSRHDVKLNWDALEAALPGIRSRVIILDMPELEIASHVIQQRVRNGQPIRHMVPRSVEAYIHKHNLYR
jgi:nicotinate-nucleotide adenylyltransferase